MLVQLTAVALLLSACTDGRRNEHLVEAPDDAGQVCLSSNEYATQGLYEADAPMFIEFANPELCIPGCASDVVAECHVQVDGNAIRIETSASWVEFEPTDGEYCPDVCSAPHAECRIDNLPAGTYTVTYGTQTSTLVVPSSTTAAVCVKS